MLKTHNLKLPILAENQAQKELLINESLIIIDALINNHVEDIINETPDESKDGDLYIIGLNPTKEDWIKFSNYLAYFYQGWRLIKPKIGLKLWLKKKNSFYFFDGSIWLQNDSSDFKQVDHQQNNIKQFANESFNSLAINSSVDQFNKLTVRSEAILFNSEENSNIQIKCNKFNNEATASYLFQTNFLSHAELGLIQDNNFQLKVSSNGQDFKSVMIVDNEQGDVLFNNNIKVQGLLLGQHNSIIDKSTDQYNLDLSKANIFEITLDNNCKFTISKNIYKNCTIFTLLVKQTHNYNISWPDNIKWPRSLKPKLVDNISIFQFYTLDKAEHWYGSIVGENY